MGNSSSDTPRPTLKAIAEELGVTPMTVSKSLRGTGRISKETRQRIREKAEELGYLSSRERLFPPLVRASNSADHRMRVLCPTVGKLERGDTELYRSEMIQGLENGLNSINGTLNVEGFNSLEDIVSLVERERYHGIVLSEPYPDKWIQALNQRAPVIYTIGYDFQRNVDSVFFNEARAAVLAVDQIRAAGHTCIGWLGVEDRHAPFHIPDEAFDRSSTADTLSASAHGTRFASWLFLANHQDGLAPWPVQILQRDWRTESLEDVVRRGCRALLRARPQPTVIVSVGYFMAMCLIDELESAGMCVPEDISLVIYGAEKNIKTRDGRLVSGPSMPMSQVGGILPEVIQRRLAYPQSLPVSIQLDPGWITGETLHHIL